MTHHSHPPHATPASPRRLRAVLVLVVVYALVEAITGWRTGSLALLADAGHMLGDALALAVALLAAVVAQRPPTARHSFGFQRAEVLGAQFNSFLLLGVAVWVLIEGIGRLKSAPSVVTTPMIIVAAGGLVLNVVGLRILHSGHADLNVRAAAWHMMGDLLGSIGALVAGALMAWKGWYLADPIASLLIAVILCTGGIRLMLETAHVLMEGAPPGVDLDEMRLAIEQVEGVTEAHDLHVWMLKPSEVSLSVHVVLDGHHHGVEVAAAVRQMLRRQFGVHHSTVQADPPVRTEPLQIGG